MPEILPFRAIRYASTEPDISRFIAPPYDVISPADREKLISHSDKNVVLLELPDGSDDPQAADSKYQHAKQLWNEWNEEGTLAQDPAASFYVMEQDFTDLSDKAGTRYTRTSVFCAVKLHDFSEGKVLPHEATLPKALGDRYELLSATEANFSPIFGMYAPTDELDAALKDLIAVAKNGPLIAEGTHILDDTTRLWAVNGTCEEARTFQKLMADTPLLIADGHHRYTVGVAHKKAMHEQLEAAGLEQIEGAPYDYIMMGIVKMDDPGLLVLPYHRAAKAALNFNADEFLTKLSENFEVNIYDGALDLIPKFLQTLPLPSFAFSFPRDSQNAGDKAGRTYVATLKQDVADHIADKIAAGNSDSYRLLDTVVLQNLVLLPLLGIDTTDKKSLERFSFTHNIDDAANISADQADVIILMRAMNLMQIADVSASGDVTPQKSTYFHPKFPSGFLFRNLKKDAAF